MRTLFFTRCDDDPLSQESDKRRRELAQKDPAHQTRLENIHTLESRTQALEKQYKDLKERKASISKENQERRLSLAEAQRRVSQLEASSAHAEKLFKVQRENNDQTRTLIKQAEEELRSLQEQAQAVSKLATSVGGISLDLSFVPPSLQSSDAPAITDSDDTQDIALSPSSGSAMTTPSDWGKRDGGSIQDYDPWSDDNQSYEEEEEEDGEGLDKEEDLDDDEVEPDPSIHMLVDELDQST
ncbi:hypothetical protein EST38_g12009 [Candolleomyces aberdarensis]|uniref:Uncharacterized protein n=1 Tax=Candolleomyces aberdarensis TaxID=2316362 RepID=A0A4Q2D5R3_9AGAR|nr:hypothetical protein EST38_g12009 [Candolleomyces aberdarensis]